MARPRDILHPDFKARPFWWEEAPPTSAGGGEAPPARADVVVVGAGYSGLNAALALRKGGAEVAVLDARPFGWGASSRNAGHVSSGVNLGKGSSSAVRSPMEGHMSADTVAALRREAGEAFDILERRLAEFSIDAGYRRSGRFVGAVSPAHYEGLAGKQASFAASGVHMVPRAEQKSEIDSDSFHGGMVVARSGYLQPAKYLHGLVAAARAAGAVLVPEMPVLGLERRAGGWRVMTSSGVVDADRVLIATNGYTGALVPWLRRRVIPAASYVVVTEPLPEGLMKTLIPQGRTIADTRRLLSYFRPADNGRRLLFGGRATLRQKPPEAVGHRLYARILRIFPQLRGIRLTHAWSGSIAFTFDVLPHVGERDGIAYCMGCNGSGVVMQSYLGWRTGEALLGGEKSAFWNQKFPSLPGYWGLPWFLPFMTGYYGLRDRLDGAG